MGLKERREREKQARREQILAAARELLHKKGLDAASMNQIAKKAELGVSTLYSYFKNKEELYMVLQQEGLEYLKAMILAALESASGPKSKLKRIALAFLQFSQERKNYYYIINHFITSPEVLLQPQLKDQVDHRAEKVIAIAEKVIKEGIENGIFKELQAKRCAIMFWALIHGLVQYRKLEKTVLKGDNHTDLFHYAVDQFIFSLCKS